MLAALLCASFAGNAVADVSPGRTGAFTATYTTAELLGDAAGRVESIISPDEPITWNVFVPPGYRPDSPAGVFVFVSPIRHGALPGKWRSVVTDKNLIWIGAKKSGNRVEVSRRILFAVLAVLVVERNYAVDTSRYYISGFSGGAKVATKIATGYPQTFSGGLFIGGADFWESERPPYLDDMQSNRYVFLAGSEDAGLRQSRQVFRAYRAAGIDNTELMIIRGMTHRTPEKKEFAEALAFLDANSRGSADNQDTQD